MITLSSLVNLSRPRRNVQRVGRGIGSKRGKTSCRGVKGDKARRGYKSNLGKEGGQLPLYRKVPTRGFSNRRFAKKGCAINLSRLNQLFKEGDTINLQELQKRGYASRRVEGGLKILSKGELKIKVRIEAHSFSKAALEKLEKGGISYNKLPYS